MELSAKLFFIKLLLVFSYWMCVFLDLPLLGSFVRTPPGTCMWVGPWRWRSRAQRRPLRSSTEARRNAESHSPSSTRRAAEVTQSSPYAWYRCPWTTVARKSFRYMNDIVTTVTLLQVMYVTTIWPGLKPFTPKACSYLAENQWWLNSRQEWVEICKQTSCGGWLIFKSRHWPIF